MEASELYRKVFLLKSHHGNRKMLLVALRRCCYDVYAQLKLTENVLLDLNVAVDVKSHYDHSLSTRSKRLKCQRLDP